MTRCNMGGSKSTTGSDEECRALGGTVEGPQGGCFVRNVFTRAVAEIILDVGDADSVTRPLAKELLALESDQEAKAVLLKRGEGDLIEMNRRRREVFASAGTDTILKLADTYQTTLDFRDELLTTTPRGEQLLRYYEDYLGEIWTVARSDFTLVVMCIRVWREAFPFVAQMVEAASKKADRSVEEDRNARSPIHFSEDDHERCVALTDAFHSQSNDEQFRQILGELKTELREYVSLTPREAVAKLRDADPR